MTSSSSHPHHIIILSLFPSVPLLVVPVSLSSSSPPLRPQYHRASCLAPSSVCHFNLCRSSHSPYSAPRRYPSPCSSAARFPSRGRSRLSCKSTLLSLCALGGREFQESSLAAENGGRSQRRCGRCVSSRSSSSSSGEELPLSTRSVALVRPGQLTASSTRPQEAPAPRPSPLSAAPSPPPPLHPRLATLDSPSPPRPPSRPCTTRARRRAVRSHGTEIRRHQGRGRVRQGAPAPCSLPLAQARGSRLTQGSCCRRWRTSRSRRASAAHVRPLSPASRSRSSSKTAR